jgi:hypothetical protein
MLVTRPIAAQNPLNAAAARIPFLRGLLSGFISSLRSERRPSSSLRDIDILEVFSAISDKPLERFQFSGWDTIYFSRGELLARASHGFQRWPAQRLQRIALNAEGEWDCSNEG